MPDPLSLGLAVLAFATAVKDTIEVFDQLKDAFSELPEGYAQAKKLMLDIHTMINAMQEAYSEQMEDQKGASALRASLSELNDEMLVIYNICSDLIDGKSKNKVVQAISSFWKGKKVKTLVEEIKVRLEEHRKLFLTLSNIRIEAELSKMSRNMQQLRVIKTNIRHLDMAKRDFEIFHSSLVPDSRLIQFNTSNLPSMTRIPESVPVQDLSQAFLRSELGILQKSVQALCNRWFKNAPSDVIVPPLSVSWFLELEPASGAAIHRQALQLTHHIYDLTKSPPFSWAHTVDVKLSHLSGYLSAFQMHEEAIAVAYLRIELCKAMAVTYPGPNTSGHLIHALTYLSILLSNTGQSQKSRLISDQALKIIRSTPEIVGLEEIQAVLARNLAVKAGNITESRTALALAESSARHMEVVLGIDNLTAIAPADSVIEGSEDSFANTVPNIGASKLVHNPLYTYGSIIFKLSETQLNNNLLQESSKTAKRAHTILNHLCDAYPKSWRIMNLLSDVLKHLTQSKLSKFNTVDENFRYAQEHETILTNLAELYPQQYVIPLMFALFTKRLYLLAMGKEIKAFQTHQKMIRIRSMVVETYGDLEIPSVTEGDYYFHLARYHYFCGRLQEAAGAAKKATEQYSSLVSMSVSPSYRLAPNKYFCAAVLLCNMHYLLKQYDDCIAEGFKALQFLEATPNCAEHTPLFDEHMELLDKIMQALKEINDSRALVWARDINSRIEKLFVSVLSLNRQIHLQNPQAPNAYVSILLDNDLIEEAGQYIDGVLERWKGTYGESTNSNMLGISHLLCLMSLTRILRMKGEIDMALNYSQEAMVIADEIFSSGFDTMKPIAYNSLAANHANLLCNAGRYLDALECSKKAVAYAQRSEAAGTCSSADVIKARNSLTIRQLYALKPREAIATASECVDLGKKAVQNLETETDTVANRLSMLYISFLNLADGLGDTGDVNQALVHLDEAKDTLLKEEEARGKGIGADVQSHQVIATRRARLLFALGRYAEAASLIEDVIEVERERAKTQKSLVSSLNRALQFARVVYCTLGRHNEGIQAATEVKKLKESLTLSPALARLVEIEETCMMSRGLWKLVQEAKDDLQCDHQKVDIDI